MSHFVIVAFTFVINIATFSGALIKEDIMELILASCGNPDHFQDPEQPMYGCESDSKVTVNSLEEASIECRSFIDRNYLGSGNWAGGDVFRDKKRIAKISYNGRIISILEK